MRVTDITWWSCLLAASLQLVAGCSEGAGASSRTNDIRSAGNLATGAAGMAGSAAPAAPALLCPASNLTQPCSCADGASGRQVCIETRGWGPCDCAQLGGQVDGDLLTGAGTPPGNIDVGVTFEDYVTPKSVGDCKPGRYEGFFTCSYEGGISPEPFQAMGLVSFVLERSANSEVLEIRDGLLDGWGGAFFFAYLNGEVSCLTRDLSGTASDGFWNPLLKGCATMPNDMPGVNCIITDPADPNYVPWNVTLEGTYWGTLDTTTDSIDGSWSMQPLDLGGTCDGTFSVMLQP